MNCHEAVIFLKQTKNENKSKKNVFSWKKKYKVFLYAVKWTRPQNGLNYLLGTLYDSSY